LINKLVFFFSWKKIRVGTRKDPDSAKTLNLDPDSIIPDLHHIIKTNLHKARIHQYTRCIYNPRHRSIQEEIKLKFKIEITLKKKFSNDINKTPY
jgi:hypothetical protein